MRPAKRDKQGPKSLLASSEGGRMVEQFVRKANGPPFFHSPDYRGR
jgi:hypothetical protein